MKRFDFSRIVIKEFLLTERLVKSYTFLFLFSISHIGHHINNTFTVFLLFLACLQDILLGRFPFIHLVIMGSAGQTFLFLID